MSGIKRFILKSTILTTIVFVVGICLYSTVLCPFFIPILWFVVPFFYVITNIVHLYLVKIASKSSSKFTSQYTAINFLKMFFYLAIAIAYVIIDKEHAKIFIANYIQLYIVYTIFEVIEFTKVVKQMNQRSNS